MCCSYYRIEANMRYQRRGSVHNLPVRQKKSEYSFHEVEWKFQQVSLYFYYSFNQFGYRWTTCYIKASIQFICIFGGEKRMLEIAEHILWFIYRSNLGFSLVFSFHLSILLIHTIYYSAVMTDLPSLITLLRLPNRPVYII